MKTRAEQRAHWRGSEHSSKGASQCLWLGATGSRHLLFPAQERKPMKTGVIFIVAIISIQAAAQSFKTNSVIVNYYDEKTHDIGRKTNYFRTEIVTNWVDAPAYYRVLNGTVYDTREWDEVSDQIAGLRLHGVGAILEVTSIGKTSITCAAYNNDNEVPPSGFPGMDAHLEGAFIRRVVIYNYPRQNEVITGQIIIGCKAMAVENWKSKGISLQAYDCGLPCTNKIPVLQMKKEKIK